MELSAAVALLKSWSEFLIVQRDNFDNYYKKTLDVMTAIGDAACVPDFKIGRVLRPRSLHNDSLQPGVVLTGQERFKIECFYVILDTLVVD